MTDNQARWILLAGMALVGPIGVSYRLRSRTGERLDRRREGWVVLVTLRPLALAAVIGLVLYLFEPRWMAWAAFPLPAWARWLGALTGAAAGLLIIWTFHHLGHNLTDTVVTRRGATLVTSGPYRWVRHPFYLAFALAVVGTTLLTANAYLAVTSAAAFAVIVVRTRTEEAHLVARFGDEYVRYMARTGRFLPKLRRSGQ